jgi:hypothetical protein
LLARTESFLGSQRKAGKRSETDRPPARKPWWLVLLLLLGGLALLGYLAWAVWLPSQMGDDARDGLVIHNHTDELLTVLIVAGDGTRPELTDLPPKSTVKTFDLCGAAELVAVDRNRAVVGRRPASDGCDLTSWVIEQADP